MEFTLQASPPSPSFALAQHIKSIVTFGDSYTNTFWITNGGVQRSTYITRYADITTTLTHAQVPPVRTTSPIARSPLYSNRKLLLYQPYRHLRLAQSLRRNVRPPSELPELYCSVEHHQLRR